MENELTSLTDSINNEMPRVLSKTTSQFTVAQEDD
jgi:hypothetical protein